MKIEEETLGPKVSTDHTGCYPNEQIEVFKHLGPRFGVAIRIIFPAGKPYTHFSVDPVTGINTEYSGNVPEGQSYIRMKSANPNISDFWRAVEEASQSADPK